LANSNTPLGPGLIYSKDFRLLDLTVLSSVTALDIKDILVELSYNEDMFSPTASGYVMVVDSSGYIEKMQMAGNEFLRMKVGKLDDMTHIIDKVFRIFKVTKRTPENEGNTETYCLYFCSEELILSEQYKISKSFKAMDITGIVKTILSDKNYGLSVQPKNMQASNFDATYGQYDFIIPNLKPFDAINWLATYARPAGTQKTADMVFFENKYGYNFKSLQNLFQTQTYNSYSYSAKNVNRNIQQLNDRVYDVSTYEIIDSFDTLSAIHSGMFASRLVSVDPLLRRYKITDYSYDKDLAGAPKLNSAKITNDFQNRNGDKISDTAQASYKLVFSNFSQNQSSYINERPGSVAHDIYAETYIPFRSAIMPLLNYTRIKISVPGDPALTVGRSINFELVSKDPNQKALDPYYSGVYLITAVRHMITLHDYKTVMELAKESMTKQLSSVPNNLPIWQNTVKGIT
jgi:hypothetical protein